ncbi:acyl-CoA dehydrogenase [Megasphaera sp. AM44-1BH]|uniref:acyl-CoA dehydrogenase family protein n=1 Tax=Megasphaera sp. AM44-1BH TaxID=2292358 RepID=UPI000E5505D4|nr:acyl-CoA dehydrogenase family protein [Megasphaera sp. AM44-1BH]RHA10189.1 acyl-CoA dehydrogenase [Megasphaera sp. AM44-1BH]
MILDEEHVMMQKVFRDFAESEFTPELQERLDTTGEFDWDMHKEMAKYGFMGARIPEEYGGQGGDTLTYVLMMEEFARVCPVLAIYPNTPNSLGGGPIMACGTEEQKKKYIPLIATGKKKLCFALTEPGAGSDAGGTTTKAVADGDDFIINGRKTFISGAPVSDYAVVYAKTDPTQKGSKGISMFIVDLKLPGVSFGKPEKKMGINGYPTSDIVFDDVRVSKNDLLGPLHNGFSTAMKTLGIGRLGVSAQALGIAQGCLEAAVKHAKEREQFGRPLAKFQAISFMLADMATEITLARELIYNTAVEFDAGKDVAAKLSMCKYFTTEMSNRVAYKAVQIHGGYGYIKDYPVERMYRDARITTLYEGTSQIQQLVIARSLLK